MRIVRVAAAVLLVLEAALLAHPVLTVNNLFVGTGVLGKALAFVRVPDVVGQGIAYLITPTVAVLLLLAAWVTVAVRTYRQSVTGALLTPPPVSPHAVARKG